MFPALFLYRPTMYLFPRVTDGWNPHPHCLHWPSKLISELRFLEEIFFSWNVPFESFVKNRQERILENSAKTVFSSEKKYGSIDTSSKKFYHRDGKIFYSIFTVHSIHFNSNFDTYVELNYSWNNSHINRIIRMLHSNEDVNDIKRNVSLEDATFHYSWNNKMYFVQIILLFLRNRRMMYSRNISYPIFDRIYARVNHSWNKNRHRNSSTNYIE